MQGDYAKTALLLAAALREIGGFQDPARTRVLDFGCGAGQLIQSLSRLGFDAYGCDVVRDRPRSSSLAADRIGTISLQPYWLPFAGESFDAVVSTSVLEHAQNKEECFREIHRVLKPGGYAMHLYPSKWYLPREPHIRVPLANYFWPDCPRWWLSLWALLGVRNEHQRRMDWRTVAEVNQKYCEHGLSYWSQSEYRDLSCKVFGDCSWPMDFYLVHAPGSAAALLRNIPIRRLSEWIGREFRVAFMVLRKSG